MHNELVEDVKKMKEENLEFHTENKSLQDQLTMEMAKDPANETITSARLEYELRQTEKKKELEMKVIKKGEVYESIVRIGIQGFEEFQFQRDADALQAIFPAEKGGRSSAVAVRGPDSRGSGKTWRLEGPPGEEWSIQLEVNPRAIVVSACSGRCRMTWTSNSPRRYFITGPLTRGAFQIMHSQAGTDGRKYKCVVQVGNHGGDDFQIVADGDVDQAIYPELPMSDQLISQTHGPDARGRGLVWHVSASLGKSVEVILDADCLKPGRDRRRAVTWQVLSPGNSIESTSPGK